MQWYYGDLHCHTNLSYGGGTMERAFEIARHHLDFAAITGHAFWPDAPTDLLREDQVIMMHLGGFAKCRKYWPRLMELVRECESDEMVTFPSYEWHSNKYGDFNVYPRGATLELAEAADLHDFQRLYDPADHMLIPHHFGYAPEERSANWPETARSPFFRSAEVHSGHGCAVSEYAPFDYRKPMGPRDGRHTAEAGLDAGLKFGFIASTDSHEAFPGEYGQGRAGVLAESKTREAIWDAIAARRTVAVTGAKILPEFEIDGVAIGGEGKASGRRTVRYRLKGNQPFRFASVVRNGRQVHFAPGEPFAPAGNGRYVAMLDWGWHKFGQMVSWECGLQVTGGSIVDVEPCLRSPGVEESNESPHAITERRDTRLAWRSKTTLNHENGGTCALAVTIEGDENTRLEYTGNELRLAATIGELSGRGRAMMGELHCAPCIRIRRVVPEPACVIEGEFTDDGERDEDWYYLWAQQVDGQAIWTSPIWIAR